MTLEEELVDNLSNERMERTQPDVNNNTRHRKTESASGGWVEAAGNNRALPIPQGYENRKLVGVNGYWYDVTNYIKHHPGGPVIEKFAGKDATSAFKGFHEKDVLKHRKPVGTYSTEFHDQAEKAFTDLRNVLQEKGLFKTSHRWYAMKILAALGCLLVCILLLTYTTHRFTHWIAALFLFFFWQQCGFFMHDFMHSQWFHEPRLDGILGTIAGSACVCICGSWWKEEHFAHHALVCTVDYESGYVDPQMKEEIWAQNEKLFPFFRSKIHWLLIKVQWLTFLPMCVLAGRIGIIIDSFRLERKWFEWVAFATHWTWVLLLLTLIPSWSRRLEVYFLASILQGILHIQLLISHYCKPFYFLKDVCSSHSWYRMQVESNINIANPIWLDWFHGGLNFHIEHHLFPRMPRHNFREASKHVRAVCRELNMPYDECGWFEAISRTVKHLKKTSTLFSLDPR